MGSRRKEGVSESRWEEGVSESRREGVSESRREGVSESRRVCVSESPAVVTKNYIKPLGKVSPGTLSSWEACVKKKGTKKSQVVPWLTPWAFPGTLGPSLGAGGPPQAS